MKEVFNTLRTKKDIIDFLNDKGEICVVYNHILKESDFYDVKNVKEIICLFGCVVTKMNKFFFNSLLSVARPNILVKSNGVVTIQFEIVDFDRCAEIMNELNEIICTANKDIDYYTSWLSHLNRVKYFMNCLKGHKRYTDNFINELRNDIEFVECAKEFLIPIDDIFFDNVEIKNRIKQCYKSLSDCYHYENLDDFSYSIGHYKAELEKALEYVS